jgi:transposase
MAVPTIAQLEPVRVTVGVDTHKDTHVAVAKDHLGRHLGETSIPTTPRGYQELLEWAESYGEVEAWGIEGTGSYGAGLSRFLVSADQVVIEINRPDRKARRMKGKSDSVDAEAATRAVLSGEATARPKSGEDRVEMIRALRAARSSAIKARTQAINAIKALVVSAPAELREQLRVLSSAQLVRTCARLRPGAITDPTAATKLALRSLAGRHEALSAEIKVVDPELLRLTNEAAPALVGLFGVGPDVAGTLLVTAGDNPERLRSEAAFAHLCGVSPIQASSGKTVRLRLNRGGDRRANAALYRIVIVRLRFDAKTKEYAERRTTEGKSKAEIIRCLKRYVAREIFAVLTDTSQKNLSAAA